MNISIFKSRCPAPGFLLIRTRFYSWHLFWVLDIHVMGAVAAPSTGPVLARSLEVPDGSSWGLDLWAFGHDHSWSGVKMPRWLAALRFWSLRNPTLDEDLFSSLSVYYWDGFMQNPPKLERLAGWQVSASNRKIRLLILPRCSSFSILWKSSRWPPHWSDNAFAKVRNDDAAHGSWCQESNKSGLHELHGNRSHMRAYLSDLKTA